MSTGPLKIDPGRTIQMDPWKKTKKNWNLFNVAANTPETHRGIGLWNIHYFSWWETWRELSQEPCLIGLAYSEKPDSFLPSCKPAELTIRPSKTPEISLCLSETEAGARSTGKSEFINMDVVLIIFSFMNIGQDCILFTASVVEIREKQNRATQTKRKENKPSMDFQ